MLVEICLPVKNEEEILMVNLPRVFQSCQKANFTFDWKIVGLINGSSDKSTKIFSNFKEKDPTHFDYLEIAENGRGRALKKYWRLSRADVLSFLDIDLAVSPDELPALIMPIVNNKADLVIGSRLLAESQIKRSYLRETVSRFYNYLARFILPNKASDLQCGFKAVRADVFRKLLPNLLDDYWFFDSELVIFSQYFSYRLQEIPVNWSENRYEKRKSKVKLARDIIRFLKNIVCLRWRLLFIPKN